MPGRRVVPTSVAPVSLFPREEAPVACSAAGGENGASGPSARRGPAAAGNAMEERGASFFSDLLHGTGLLAAEVEQGLWELVAAGLVTADGFDNLRALLDPHRRRAEGRERSAARASRRAVVAAQTGSDCPLPAWQLC